MEDPTKNIITFCSFDNPVIANLVKSKLEDAGIPCFLTDENTLSLMPFFNPILGGIKLKIFEADQEKVKEIMRNTMEVNEDTLISQAQLPKAD